MTDTKKTDESDKKAAPRRRPAADESGKKAVAAAKAKKGDEATTPAGDRAESASAEKKGKAVSGEYIYALGRRKSAIAQTRLFHGGKGEIRVGKKTAKEYFRTQQYVDRLYVPLKAVGLDSKVTVELKLTGGGLNGQADAATLGIARALVKDNPDHRATLKKMGLLTRDSREKERKKYGLKKARKGPQWAKR